MIGYIEGRIIRYEADEILLLAGHVGYEILVSPPTLELLKSQGNGQEITSLYIYYHVTDRQPKPVLIGFLTMDDKEFFQLFISVAAIGPMKAVKALTRPVEEVARAIEDKDVGFLSKLSGIGKRTAEKIIATLHGKAIPFAGSAGEHNSQGLSSDPDTKEGQDHAQAKISSQVADVLVEQLGHSLGSAKRMIHEAFARNPDIKTPEDLFDEIFKEPS